MVKINYKFKQALKFKLLSQKNNSKAPQINVANPAKGVYIIQMTDKYGNSGSGRFVKE